LINVLLRFETVCLTIVYGAGMIEILEKKKGILVIGGPDFWGTKSLAQTFICRLHANVKSRKYHCGWSITK